jgi:hypothetical protein
MHLFKFFAYLACLAGLKAYFAGPISALARASKKPANDATGREKMLLFKFFAYLACLAGLKPYFAGPIP